MPQISGETCGQISYLVSAGLSGLVCYKISTNLETKQFEQTSMWLGLWLKPPRKGLSLLGALAVAEALEKADNSSPQENDKLT